LRGHRSRHSMVARSSAARWRLTGSKVFGQEEQRWGSPRRSGDDGVAGSGRRGGVLVEGGSSEVAASSGVVLRLEAEAKEGTVGVASERDEKQGAGGIFLAGSGRQCPFKRGGGGTQWRGLGSQATRGAEQGRERGPGHGGKRLGRAAGRARRGREWLTGGTGRVRAQWAATGCRASATRRGADTWARQHSAARFGF
jgi:hypothetical protein